MVEEENKVQKPPKRGIIYLATIPPYMNVSKIKEFFSQFGTVGRVYLQKAENFDPKKKGKDKKPKKKGLVKFVEGWVEFERKSVAKKVAIFLNNKQVDTRKKSKQYDSLWSIKYLPSFKWAHLNESLIYKKQARRQKLRKELERMKMKSNKFSGMVKKKRADTNKEFENLEQEMETAEDETSQSNNATIIENLW